MYDQPFNPYEKNLSVIKEYFRKPVVLVCAIANAVSIIFTVITSILISIHGKELYVYIRDMVLWIIDELDLPFRDDFLMEYNQLSPSSFSSGSIASSLPSLIFPALIVAAFLIIYFKSRSTAPYSSPKPGVMILYVISVIILIVSIIGAVALVAAIVILIVACTQIKDFNGRVTIPFFDKYFSIDISKPLLLVLLIAAAVMIAVALFFLLFISINKKRFYGSIKDSLTTVDLHTKGAGPYGVVCVLGAVSMGLSCLSMPSILFVDLPVELPKSFTVIIVLSMLAAVASTVAMTTEAIIALGYKTFINNVKYGYHTPAAPAAPYAPFNAGPGYYAAQNQQQPPFDPYMYNRTAAPDESAEPAEPGSVSTDNAYSDPYGTDAPYTEDADAPAEEFGVPYDDDAMAAAADAAPTDGASSPADEASAEPDAAVCPGCGADVEPGTLFCGNCGKKL